MRADRDLEHRGGRHHPPDDGAALSDVPVREQAMTPPESRRAALERAFRVLREVARVPWTGREASEWWDRRGAAIHAVEQAATEGEPLNTMTPVPPDDGRIIAWELYKTTGQYVNTKLWATLSEHTEGSLWAAFLEGWTACSEQAATEGEDDWKGSIRWEERDKERVSKWAATVADKNDVIAEARAAIRLAAAHFIQDNFHVPRDHDWGAGVIRNHPCGLCLPWLAHPAVVEARKEER